jgi:hypothetical protein
MKGFTGLVNWLSRVLDVILGLLLAGVMLLIVANILLQTLFKSPVLGTYEYVGFLTAALIGLSLANCAVIYFILGCFIDALAMVLLIIPIFYLMWSPPFATTPSGSA